MIFASTSCISTKPAYRTSSVTWLTVMPVRSDMATRVRLSSGDWRTQSELYFRMKREVQSSIRVTPMPKLNREPPPRWRSRDSQVATASSVLYLAQSGWLMTPALLMTGSTDVQPGGVRHLCWYHWWILQLSHFYHQIYQQMIVLGGWFCIRDGIILELINLNIYNTQSLIE